MYLVDVAQVDLLPHYVVEFRRRTLFDQDISAFEYGDNKVTFVHTHSSYIKYMSAYQVHDIRYNIFKIYIQ